MPDRTNILVPYAIVCVLNVRNYRAEGWGFAVFDYTKQQFSVGATDVVRARRSGAAIPSIQLFGSPVVVGRNVTFYSWTCCSVTSGVYATTVNASATALKKRASYVPKRLPAVPMTYDLHVGARSKTHGKFSMYVLGSPKGQYSLYASSSPTGPWSPVGSGVLPRCNRATPCHSVALHPELSPAGRLIVSYHLPGYGPGVATKHPYPHDPLSHVVVASLPCSC
jgi:hypothetical protein